MSYAAERQSIEQRFQQYWQTETPIAYQNVPFTPPEQTAWVRVHVLPGASGRIEMSNNPRFRCRGIIDVTIFLPLDTAVGRGDELVDTVVPIFRASQFDGITCRSADVAHQGVRNGWYQINVTIPYFRDEQT